MSDEKRTTTRAVLDRLVGQGFMFTALDVSNEVKTTLNVRHREISPLVREMFEAGDLADYEQTLIDVVLGNGKTVQAFLYHHEDDDADDYDGTLRSQRATPPRQGSGAPAPVAATPQATPAPPPGPQIDSNTTELTLNWTANGGVDIPAEFVELCGLYDSTVHLDAAGVGSGLVLLPADACPSPLAELDVDDVVHVPSARLGAFDKSHPLTARRGARRVELEGSLR